ncbi:MAG: hypothetical protein Q9180_006695 [Flavoplaca navasiana]
MSPFPHPSLLPIPLHLPAIQHLHHLAKTIHSPITKLTQHSDHFDTHVESSLRRSLPIITTPHAKSHLASKADGEAFTDVYDLDFFEDCMVDIQGNEKRAAVKVTGMPGKHVPPGVLGTLNEIVEAVSFVSAFFGEGGMEWGVEGEERTGWKWEGYGRGADVVVIQVPPTNGWMMELGYKNAQDDFKCGYRYVLYPLYPTPPPPFPFTSSPQLTLPPLHPFSTNHPIKKTNRIYISGDTLLIPELHEIPTRYAGQNIDLMLIHLGGTTIPSPAVPLLMVTMDAEQGLGLVKLVRPELTIPIHDDDYDVFRSPLEDFKKKMQEAGLQDKVVYLDRGDRFDFQVKG